jgi:hypothetical protein
VTWIALLALLQAPDEGVVLRHGGDRGDAKPVACELTLTLDLKGNDAALNFLRSSSPFFSFSKIHYRGDGARRVARVARKGETRFIHVELDEARVDGTYDDEPYEFDFARSAPPDDLKSDSLKGILWGISMSNHEHSLSPAGAVVSSDATQDAFGEALTLLHFPMPRFTDKAVKPGDAWESKWRGDKKDKQRRAWFEYVQKVRLEKLEDGRAELSIELAGTLEGEKDPNAGKQETKVEGKAKAVLDAKTGFMLSHESKGTVAALYRGVGPDGAENEINVVFAVTSRQETK